MSKTQARGTTAGRPQTGTGAPRHPPVTAAAASGLEAELIALLVAVTSGEPRVLTIDDGASLPSGPFESTHRSLQAGLRSWVERQTHHPLGYVEQLYTFADRDRTADFGAAEAALRVISVGYLGLTRETPARQTPPHLSASPGARWRGWYEYFPWEDHRHGVPSVIERHIAPALARWSEASSSREQRAAFAFGLSGRAWNEELVLARYELLWEAGLVPESPAASSGPPSGAADRLGRTMTHDHRRILATGLARLRAKIKYRPVVFELLGDTFTMLQLQHSVEALAGRRLHKQNFRRLIDGQQLVEETGARATQTGGRPAKLFRFRRDVQLERALSGARLPLARS